MRLKRPSAAMVVALPAGLASMVGKLNPQIDKYVVEAMLGPEMLGLYGAAALEAVHRGSTGVPRCVIWPFGRAWRMKTVSTVCR